MMRQFAASWVWWGLRARSEFSELAFVLEPDRQSKSFVVRRPCKASSAKVSTGRRRTFGILSRDGRSHVNDGDARKGPVAFPVCAATLPSTAASCDCGGAEVHTSRVDIPARLELHSIREERLEQGH